MKKILFYALAAAALFAGCTRTDITENKGEGTLSIQSVMTDNGLIETSAVTKANDNINDFIITISRQGTTNIVEYVFSDIRQTSIVLTPGIYTVSAKSPEELHAAWDLPIYYGESEVEIIAGEHSSVNIECEITNMKVDIIIGDNLKTEFTEYNVTVTNNAFPESKLTWVKDETTDDFEAGKSGYYTVAPLTVALDGIRSLDGSEYGFRKIITDVAPKRHFIIKLDATVTGNLEGVNIILDGTMVDDNQEFIIDGIEEVPVEGDPNDPKDPTDPDEPDQPSTLPSLEWAANPTFADTEIKDGMDVNLVVKAPEKIADFKIDVKSDALSPTIAALCTNTELPASGIATMDLINDTVLIENLNGMALGIPTGENVKGQTEVPFSLSALIPLINVYNPEPGSVHSFTLNITDEKGQKFSKQLNFITPAN